MNSKYDYIVVGAGLSGAVIARELVNKGKKVLVLEKRNRVGGQIATHIEDGIIIHDYGPHIFHTSYEDVWEYINKYSKTYPFVNMPLANYNGEIYNMPFNMNTFKQLWGVTTPEEAKKIIDDEVVKEGIGEPRNLEEQALKLVGRTIYEKLIKGYTEKQWGRKCRDLPSFIIKRLPLRFEYNNNYFNDKYQCEVDGGFSSLIDNLLKGIEVKTGVDYLSNREHWNQLGESVIYTGMIDAFFDFQYGQLEYRSLRFETKKLNIPDFQGNPVVNYTSSKEPYTRITEHKHFDPNCKNNTTTFVSYEYPAKYEAGNDPYYPVIDDKNTALFNKYVELSKTLPQKTYFAGRLGNYKYYDMDDAIKEALSLVEKLG